MRPLARIAFATAGLLAVSGGAALAQQQQITVYCSILEEQCREGVAIFERVTGIKVLMVRKSTGEAYAQIKAEATNPKADVWWGGPAEPHLQAGEEGLLEGYASPVNTQLHDWAQRLATQSANRTSGTYLGALGIGYNLNVLKRKNLPEPKCWADLLAPGFRDEVQMADPNSSGTAYVMLATLVQLMGEDKGFDYMKALHKNMSQYTKSGIAPVKAVALGETGVAIGFMHDLLTQILDGAPIKTVAPCEGTGYETGAVSMVKGSRNTEAARKFFDFTLSPDAQNINVKLKINSIPSNLGSTVAPEAPKLSEIKLINYDTAKYGAAAERRRLLAKWTQDVQNLPK